MYFSLMLLALKNWGKINNANFSLSFFKLLDLQSIFSDLALKLEQCSVVKSN